MSATSTLLITTRKLIDRVIERQDSLPPWPDPEESIGTFYRSVGRHQCWEMRGKAREMYLRLAGDIKTHLERHGDVVSATVIWAAYMIGKTKQCANPTVFFCSRDSKPRKAVRSEIDGSGLLSKYPGFRTGDCPRPPHLGQLRQLAVGEEVIWEPGPTGPSTTCRNPMGHRIYIEKDDSRLSPTPATVGALFELEESLYFATVAHAFLELDHDALACESPTDSAFEWDFDGDNDDAVEVQTPQMGPHRVHIHNDLIPETDMPGTSATEQPGVQDKSAEQPISYLPYSLQDVCFSSVRALNRLMDYCLVEYKQDDPRLFGRTVSTSKSCTYHSILPQDISCDGPHEDDVVAYTGSRHANHGKMSGTPCFMTIAGGYATQELWSIHLEGILQNGDCGSAVIGISSGNLEGHIIAGDLETGSALIIPAYQMLQNMQQNFDYKIRLHKVQQCFGLKRPVEQDTIAGASESLEYATEEPNEGEKMNDWAAEMTSRFRRLLSQQRMRRLKSFACTALPLGSEVTVLKDGSRDPLFAARSRYPLCINNIPREPQPPSDGESHKFRKLLLTLSDVPCRWENPTLLDKALSSVPLDRIYDEAQAETDTMTGLLISLGDEPLPALVYKDYVIRALMKWFKRNFFQWVENPECSVCCGPTSSVDIMVPPTINERARSATRVEILKCCNEACNNYERFPRYTDPFVALRNRRGREGEWVNCFSMLCRALGSRVRYVWTPENHLWTEVYSSHLKRWVHVDPCQEIWDNPLKYVEELGRKLSYCIAFSVEGCYDVTRRYVSDPTTQANLRNRCPEQVLWHIVREITALRRADWSETLVRRSRNEDQAEQQVLRMGAVKALIAHGERQTS